MPGAHQPPRLLVLAAVPAAVVAMAQARAMEGPESWMEALCEADALVEVEVRLSATSAPDARGGKAKVLDVLWNRVPNRRVRPQMDLGLPDRRALAQQMRHRGRPSGQGYAPGVFALFEEALRGGRYRAKHFVAYNRQAGFWGGVMGVVEHSHVHWVNHPRHAAWWRYLEPLLAERRRLARDGRLPEFCQSIREASFSTRQQIIEAEVEGR